MGWNLGLRSAGVCGLLVGGLAASIAWKPFKLRNTRHRRTPEGAADYFYGQVAREHYDLAWTALIGYSLALRRHETLPQGWAHMNPGGIATDARIERVIVSRATSLGDDFAVVRVQLEFARTTAVNVPVAHIHVTHTTSRNFEALRVLVRREKRWYVVNGLPPDVIDRELISAIKAGKGI